MKVNKDLVMNVLAFTFGSLIAEIMIQRQERKGIGCPKPDEKARDAAGLGPTVHEGDPGSLWESD